MTPSRKIEVLVPIVGLRERRLDLARREAARAREAVAAAAATLSAREDQLARCVGDIARLDAWFAERVGGAATLLQAGLARREALAAAKATALQDRDEARQALEAARTVLADAVADVQRAEGRRDAMSDQLADARSRRRSAREEHDQLELEDLAGRRGW